MSLGCSHSIMWWMKKSARTKWKRGAEVWIRLYEFITLFCMILLFFRAVIFDCTEKKFFLFDCKYECSKRGANYK